MHDLSLKPGRKTTEFLLHAATIITYWVGAILVLLGDIGPALPAQDKTWVAIAVAVLTSIQTTVYSLQRGKLKEAAVSAVAAVNQVEAGVELAKQGLIPVTVNSTGNTSVEVGSGESTGDGSGDPAVSV